jgi:UDP-glucose 4-epimerase
MMPSEMTHLVTGGAGFIAHTLIRRLLERGDSVLAIDNLSRGSLASLERFSSDPLFSFRQADCADYASLRNEVGDALGTMTLTNVWHLAANSDVPAGVEDPEIDLRDTFLTTFNVLKLMREFAVPNLHFASSSAIYGDLGDRVADEAAGPLEPISNYGAMKLASEAQIRASVESHIQRADIFRFPNVIGTPATHGVILDFVRKLKATPSRLDVLGNGTQRKPYLHVEELVDAMLYIQTVATGRYNVFNIGPKDIGVTVGFIAETVQSRMSNGANICYGAGDRGWVGDVPKFQYSTSRLQSLGWEPRMDSKTAVMRAVNEIIAEQA